MKDFLRFSAFLFISFTGLSQANKQEEKVNITLDSWHQASADTNFEEYRELAE